MFLDPDPRGQKQAMSGLLSPQSPMISPREARAATTKRKPLHERTKSQNNSRPASRSPIKTVRLVSPSSPSTPAQASSDGESRKENRAFNPHGKVARLRPQFDIGKEASVSKLASPPARGYGVSASPASTNEAKDHPVPSKSSRPHSLVDQTAWDASRIVSDNYSQSSTLHVDDSEVSLGQKSGNISRISEGTTLRDTPPPDDQFSTKVDASEVNPVRFPAEPTTQTQPLQSLPAHPIAQYRGSESTTVRAVQPEIMSSSSPNVVVEALSPTDDPCLRPQTASSESDFASKSSFESPRRRSSPDGSAAWSDARSIPTRNRPGAALGFYASQESLAQSEATISPTSSPNLVAFSSPYTRTRVRSNTHPLRYEPSYETIDVRIGRSPSLRPATGRSFATNHSPATNSSNDTLPSLRVPKKRLRAVPGSHSLRSQASSSNTLQDGPSDDFDAEPYPRQVFSGHLSTIASESDRTASQQLSQFSLGSGVWSGDDASLPPSATWQRQRYDGSAHDSARQSLVAQGSSSEEDPGDMTLGIFREASLIPQPLFREEAPPLPLANPETARLATKISMLNVPESDEHVDTLSALQAPPLRQKRSGYSVRGKGNSTPGQVMSHPNWNESERWSDGSIIFPLWAKHYYSGTAVLSSKISMSTIGSTRVRPVVHSRRGSTWTERSSRLGTARSNATSGRSRISRTFESPSSSAFIPSIFRPRTRLRRSRASEQQQYDSTQNRRSDLTSDSRPDSMAIMSDSIFFDENGHEVLPSGQRRWGTLRDADARRRPMGVPRLYSRQREWDGMEFPRPMTQDQAEYCTIPYPRLVPSRRQGRPSAWRPPSFAESLDTLIHSHVNRQILLFALGFICPLSWMLGAVLPLPRRPAAPLNFEEHLNSGGVGDIEAASVKHAADEVEMQWVDELSYLKGKWWRMLNRVMSVVGVLVIGAIIALAVVATR